MKRGNQKFNISLVLQALLRTTSGLFVARDLRPGSAGRPKGPSLRFPLSISSRGSLGRRRISAGRLGRGLPRLGLGWAWAAPGGVPKGFPSRLQPGLCLAGLAPPPWGLLFRKSRSRGVSGCQGLSWCLGGRPNPLLRDGSRRLLGPSPGPWGSAGQGPPRPGLGWAWAARHVLWGAPQLVTVRGKKGRGISNF